MDVTDLVNRIEAAEATIHCLKVEIIKMGRESIRWTEADFRDEANRTERRRKMLDIYDRNEFSNALFIMMEKYDPEVGITWDLVRMYLDEHCLKDK